MKPQKLEQDIHYDSSEKRVRDENKSSNYSGRTSTADNKLSATGNSNLSDQLYDIDDETARRVVKTKRGLRANRIVQETGTRREEQTEERNDRNREDGRRILELFPEFSPNYIIEVLNWTRANQNFQRISAMQPIYPSNVGCLGFGVPNYSLTPMNFASFPIPLNNDQNMIGSPQSNPNPFAPMNFPVPSYQQITHEYNTQMMPHTSHQIISHNNPFNMVNLMEASLNNNSQLTSSSRRPDLARIPTEVTIPDEDEEVIVIDDSSPNSRAPTPQRTEDITDFVAQKIESQEAETSRTTAATVHHKLVETSDKGKKQEPIDVEQTQKKNDFVKQESTPQPSNPVKKSPEKKIDRQETEKEQENPTNSNVLSDLSAGNNSSSQPSSSTKRTLSPNSSATPAKKSNTDNSAAKTKSKNVKLHIDMLGQTPVDRRRKKSNPRERFSPSRYL